MSESETSDTSSLECICPPSSNPASCLYEGCKACGEDQMDDLCRNYLDPEEEWFLGAKR